MSEYHYYEWQTVDRLLTAAEQDAVSRLSSHIEVSSSKAVVTYNWSDFKHDPRQVLLKYFDAYFYWANWGSTQLMFRFPKGMLEKSRIEPYLRSESVSLETVGEYEILDLDFNPEDSGWMEETDLDLSDFLPLRAALLEGDTRMLYLAWLKDMTLYGEPILDGEEEDNEANEIEPPVPPGLKKLTPALGHFVRGFAIDPFLVAAAAEASPDFRASSPVDTQELVGRLSRQECDDFLARLAEGDAGVGMALRKRLREMAPPSQLVQNAGKRSLRELIERSHQLHEAEKQRKAASARRQHIAAMKELAKREPQAWQEIERLLETGSKSGATYDQATERLENLWQLSEFQDTREKFLSQVRRLAEKFSSRPSLMQRWRERGWI